MEAKCTAFCSLVVKVTDHFCCILFLDTFTRTHPGSKGGKIDFTCGCGHGKVLGKHVELEVLLKPFFENICLSTRLEAIRYPSTYFLCTLVFYWGFIPHSSPFHPLSKRVSLCLSRFHFPVCPLDPPLPVLTFTYSFSVTKPTCLCRCHLALFMSSGNWGLGR